MKPAAAPAWRRAVTMAALAALAAAPAAGALDGVPAERLVGEPEAQGRPATPAGLTTPADLIAPLPLTPAATTAALRAASTVGFVGGEERRFAPIPGRADLRAWAARLRSQGDALGLREALRRAAVGTPGARALPGVAGARLVQMTGADGRTTIVALLASGPWLHGVEAGTGADGAAPDPAEVRTLVGALADRARALAAAGPPAAAREVDASLIAALAAARATARGLRAGAGPAPREGTVQAASLDGVGHAIALFPGAPEPEHFRRAGDGGWRWVGDMGGPGCPRLAPALRELWGLATTCPTRMSPVAVPAAAGRTVESPLEGVAIWVWEGPKVGGAEGIITRARSLGIDTVYVKSGDGVRYWRQFDDMIAPLQAAGLRVCGWQYIYGRAPVAEARIAARAMRRGADCFIVNAEIEFERMGVGAGSRAQRTARAYMRELRRLVGRRVPVGLSSFAYVDGHMRFPYSAFLGGRDGADVNLPQVYWGAFRVPVADAMARTAAWNSLYGRPIAPTAGTYSRESVADLRRFRCLAAGMGWHGVSYWSLQHTGPAQVRALSVDAACEAPEPTAREYPVLRPGKVGDPTLLLQQRLVAWGYPVGRDGRYGPRTRAGVAAFQRDRGAKADGVAGPATWALLLEAPGA